MLKEVRENVNDVIISGDGSWKAIMESNDHAEKQQDEFPSAEQDEPNASSFSNAPPDFLDLTGIDDVIYMVGTCEAEERKVFPLKSQNQFSIQDVTIRPPSNNTNGVPQINSALIDDNLWSDIYLSTFGSGSSSLMSDAQIGGIPQSTRSSILPCPVLTDAISCEAGAFNANAFLANSAPQSEITSPTAMQLREFQFGNSATSNEYGRSLSLPRHVSRTPIAIQALPAQAPTIVPPRVRNSTSKLMQNGTLAASQTSALAPVGDGFSGNSSSRQRQQKLSRSHPISHQVPRMVSSSQQQHSNIPVNSPHLTLFVDH